MNHVDPEQALRASLQRHADDAPRADLLAERVILHAGEGAPRRFAPRWRTWALPVLASASVAAVVVGVTVSGTFDHSASPGNHTGTSISRSVSPSVNPPPTSSPRPQRSATAVNGVGLTNFRVADLTFGSETHGWALGTADCLSGAGTCSAIVETTNGRTWTALGKSFSTPFDVEPNCTGNDPCVAHIRFANDSVGYAFGPSALFLTQDGGQKWTQLKGGALFLETLDQNVIRVTGTDGGCPGPCNVRVETSAVGATTWTDSGVGPLRGAAALDFSRGGSDAYLLFRRNPAGGAGGATSTLYRSIDDGGSWAAAGEPCPQASGEVDSYAVAAAPQGRAAVLCATRQAPQRWFVATSSDDGAHFSGQPGIVPASASTLLAGDPKTVLVAGGASLARSTDGGRTWHAIGGIHGVSFVGFESTTVGRAVSSDGRRIWTTTDAGAHWTPFTFP